MTDVYTTEQRSYNMSRIRCKWTKQERLLHNWPKGKKIKHKMHHVIEGKPDILIIPFFSLFFESNTKLTCMRSMTGAAPDYVSCFYIVIIS